MNDVSIKSAIDKLESLFSKFNEHFYEGKIEKPIITISPDSTSGSYGWCTCWKAWAKADSEEDGYYEINMCAEHMNRPFKEICATLLHEMVHLWNLQNDIQDTSRSGTYHNKKFKTVAEEHGLIIEKDDKYGWTKTTLNEETEIYVAGLDDNGFGLYRKQALNTSTSKSKQSTRKYVCPICGCIIRATKEVRVMCVDCDVEFEEEN